MDCQKYLRTKETLLLNPNMVPFQERSYHFGQIVLHWFIAILVLYQFVSSNTFSGIKLSECQGTEVILVKCQSLNNHYVVGSLILVLMVFRVGMRIYFGAPMLSSKIPLYIKVLGKISHLSLYLLVILMPITGLLGWHSYSALMFPIHIFISKGLLFLILIHICAVAFHEGILGSSLIYRMTSFNNKLKK